MRTLLAITIFTPLLSAQRPLNDPENPAARDAQAIEAGRKQYVGSCAGCHGATGEGGRGPALRDGKLIRRSTDFQVFNTIRKGVAGTDMPGTNLPDTQIWQLVAFVRGLGSPAAETIFPGDAVKGERIYSLSGCATCHTIAGRGGSLGPDLSNCGGTRSYEYIRESILKPNERVTYGYQKLVAKLKDGRTIKGTARNYSNYDVQINGKDGELYLIKTSDLADLQVTVSSYMPEGYGKKLSREEMVDLVAYLSRQTNRPVTSRKQEQKRGGIR